MAQPDPKQQQPPRRPDRQRPPQRGASKRAAGQVAGNATGESVADVFAHLASQAARRRPLDPAARPGSTPALDPVTGAAGPTGSTGDGEVPGVLRGHSPDSAQPRTVRTVRGRSGRRVRYVATGKDGRALYSGRQPAKLGAVLAGEVRNRGWSQALANGWVLNNWEELVGPKIAQHTTIEMVKETTLFLSCDSTSWATNLRLMQRQILATIAKKVGPGVVTELKIFGPKAPSWRKGPLHVKGRGPRDTYG